MIQPCVTSLPFMYSNYVFVCLLSVIVIISHLLDWFAVDPFCSACPWKIHPGTFVIPRNRCLCVYIIARRKLTELLMTIISFCMEIMDSRNTLTVPVCSAIIWHEFCLNRAAVMFGIDVFWQTHANIMSWKCLLCDWPFVREIQWSLVDSF